MLIDMGKQNLKRKQNEVRSLDLNIHFYGTVIPYTDDGVFIHSMKLNIENQMISVSNFHTIRTCKNKNDTNTLEFFGMQVILSKLLLLWH